MGEVVTFDQHVGMCHWPVGFKNKSLLNVMFVADPQLQGLLWEPKGLLGNLTRNDADRYLRRAFHVANENLAPDVVVVLGDVFDEGYPASDAQLIAYHRRLMKIFKNNGKTKLIVTAGDNDIGGEGGDAMTQLHIMRFEDIYGSVNRVITIGRVNFIAFNSLAFLDKRVEHAVPVMKFLKKYADSKTAQKQKLKETRTLTAAKRQDKVREMVHPVKKGPVHSVSWKPDDDVAETRNADIVVSHIPTVELPAYVKDAVTSGILPDAVLSGHTHEFDLYRHTVTRDKPSVVERYVPAALSAAAAEDGEGADTMEPMGSIEDAAWKSSAYERFLYHLGPKYPERHAAPEKTVVPEVTVPTFSYRMGTSSMGYVLASISVCDFPESTLDYVSTFMSPEELANQWSTASLPFHPGYEWRFTSVQVSFAHCTLPQRYPWLIAYGVALVVCGLFLLAAVLLRGCLWCLPGAVARGKLQRHDSKHV